MITDKLRSYDAAKREIMPGVEHRSHSRIDSLSCSTGIAHHIPSSSEA
ncbi:hypothetical protein FB593_1232 [Rhizobium sp. SJZ105]|nr:hypothetical protein FB593_1232 [Rhizobium sp. SJZ105]